MVTNYIGHFDDSLMNHLIQISFTERVFQRRIYVINVIFRTGKYAVNK